jgi:hypothetical protein
MQAGRKMASAPTISATFTPEGSRMNCSTIFRGYMVVLTSIWLFGSSAIARVHGLFLSDGGPLAGADH